MSGKPFDIERIRKNWERAIAPEPAELPPKIAQIPRPLDPYPEARAVLDRIVLLAKAEVPNRMDVLAPFFNEAATLIGQMEAHAKNAAKPTGGDAPAAPAKDMDALREEIQKVLYDIEDLLEVFSGIGR